MTKLLESVASAESNNTVLAKQVVAKAANSACSPGENLNIVSIFICSNVAMHFYLIVCLYYPFTAITSVLIEFLLLTLISKISVCFFYYL